MMSHPVLSVTVECVDVGKIDVVLLEEHHLLLYALGLCLPFVRIMPMNIVFILTPVNQYV
jgi:hypothetical protein